MIEIRVVLNENQNDIDNILNGMRKIMNQDLRPAYIKCNPQDVHRIKNSGLKHKSDKDNTYYGMKLIESNDIKLSEIFIISQ